MAKESSPVSYAREKYTHVRTTVMEVTDVCVHLLYVISVVSLLKHLMF